MFSLFKLTLIALLATSAYAQTYTINTPLSVVVCLPVLISWAGGTPPYFLVSVSLYFLVGSILMIIYPLSILPAGQPSAPALIDLGQQTGTSVTWIANLGVGTGAFLNLRDSTGTLAQSGTFTVQPGTNTSCVGQAAVTSAGPGGATAGGATGASPTAPATSGSGTAPTTKASTSSTTKAATPSKAAAVAQYAPVGAAAVIGAALLSLVL